MRFLHTSDWHIGKTLKGHNRLPEQREILQEIVGIARQHGVDAVLIAGDIYDSASPSAEAQQLLVRTLLEIRIAGVPVVAIAGYASPPPGPGPTRSPPPSTGSRPSPHPADQLSCGSGDVTRANRIQWPSSSSAACQGS